MDNIEIPASIQPGDHSDVLVAANTQLVEKGRTMSIDEALSHGILFMQTGDCLGRPRILSTDSVDYTQMLYGNEDEEVVEKVRKDRKANKHTKPYSFLYAHCDKTSYAAAVKNGIPAAPSKGMFLLLVF